MVRKVAPQIGIREIGVAHVGSVEHCALKLAPLETDADRNRTPDGECGQGPSVKAARQHPKIPTVEIGRLAFATIGQRPAFSQVEHLEHFVTCGDRIGARIEQAAGQALGRQAQFAHIDPGQDGTMECRAAQLGPGQISAGHDRVGKDGTPQVGAPQLGSLEGAV